MHELGIMRSIINLAIQTAEENCASQIIEINLLVGQMRSFQKEWVQRFTDYFSKGTIAEGAQVKIQYVPVTCHCLNCDHTFSLDVNKNEEMNCPECQSEEFKLLTGDEMIVKNIRTV